MAGQDAAQTPQQPLVLVTETDAYIHERMKGQPKSLEDVQVQASDRATDAKNILALPKELEKYKENFAFRWVNKKPRAIAHAIDIAGWSMVNRTLFKDLPNHLFTGTGAIERGDAILCVTSRKRAEFIRLQPAKLSRERVMNTPVQPLDNWKDRGEQYYKPTISQAEADGGAPRGRFVEPDEPNTEE